MYYMKQQITLDKLKKAAEQFAKREYNLSLTIPIEVNNRLKKTLGRYLENEKGDPLRIDISGRLLTYAHYLIALGVVKHEVVHYALNKLNKPAKDGEDYFERELERLNLPSSTNQKRVILYVGEKYVFNCSNCNKELTSTIKNSKQNPHLYRSSCCNKQLKFKKTIVCDGTAEGVCLFLNRSS